jgi:hypothetical protein
VVGHADQWLASVRMDGVNVPLGYYDSDADAAIIVDSFVKENGLKQRLNFPNGLPDPAEADKCDEKKEQKKKKKKKVAKKRKRKKQVDDQYVGHVEAILGCMVCLDGVVRYLVKWEGFEDIDNTWEPRENLDCDGLVEEFEVNLRTERTARAKKHDDGLNCFHKWENNVWGHCPLREVKVCGKPFVYVRSCVISSSLIVQNMLTMQQLTSQFGEDEPISEHPLLLERSKKSAPDVVGTSPQDADGKSNNGKQESAADLKADSKQVVAKPATLYCYGTVNSKAKCCCAECGIPYTLLCIFMGNEKGFGVVAGEDIPAGAQVCEYVGELLERSVVRKRELSYKKKGLYYLFEPSLASFIIDATFNGGVARFINHSCNPSCKSKEIVQVATCTRV